jgi:HK97 family phage prohead protease
MDLERRVVSSARELRSQGGKNTLTGYAAVFNSMSEDPGGFREIIKPGAFDASLASGANVMARAHHDTTQLLGTSAGGTLRLSVGGRGLRYEVDVPGTTAGRDTLELVRRGDIARSSFALYRRAGIPGVPRRMAASCASS